MFDLFKLISVKSETDFKKLKEEGAVIIDVRTEPEYLQGHIKGSKNIPLNVVKSNLKYLKSLDAKIILVCRTGIRSDAAKKILLSEGIPAFNGGSWLNLNKILKK
jgi:phage shock protein E